MLAFDVPHTAHVVLVAIIPMEMCSKFRFQTLDSASQHCCVAYPHCDSAPFDADGAHRAMPDILL